MLPLHLHQVFMILHMILHQVGQVVSQEDRVFLFESCALDLYGVEFCGGMKMKYYKEVEKSYHWLVKRTIGESKFYGNHQACFESGLLTWELLVNWKVFIIWENIINSDNEILQLFFDEDKWDTILGKRVKDFVMFYGKDVDTAKELKKIFKLFIEAMCVLKEGEEEVEEEGEEDVDV